jgi:hypothetical protein
LLCVKHWFKELDDPQAAAGPSQAFADTPIGQHFLRILVKDDRRHKEIYLSMSFEIFSFVSPYHT